MQISHSDLDLIRELSLPDRMQRDGIQLKQLSPTSFKALCPFHPDKNPSLSINLKGKTWLWNCFGCGAGGDIIKYTMLQENKSFQDITQSMLNTDPTYIQAPSHQDALTYAANHYHQALKDNKAAQDYLATRGLMDLALIKKYKLGYCNGDMPHDPDLVVDFKALGIINEKTQEHFKGCITFPIEDSNGRIVSMYGRSIKAKRHLYLKGPHIGVFNQYEVRQSSKIYITESIIDALSLIQLGIKDSIALYGTNGFTKDHQQILDNPELKEVVLCMDNDSAGLDAATRIKNKLSQSLTIKTIHLPEQMKDCNDYLLAKHSKTDLIQLEQIMHTVSSNTDWVESDDNRDLNYKTKTKTYRVRGLTIDRADTLKISLKLTAPNGSHFDTLDLYSAKSRIAFSKDAFKFTKIDDEEIQKDLLILIDKLELKRAVLIKNRGKTKQVFMTDTERREALEFLKDPNLIERIVADAKITGHVGEENNFLLGYLVSISRKSNNPLGLLVISQSSAGKTALQDKIVYFTPPEDVIQLTRLTDQSLFYQERDALMHKLLTIEEEEGAKGAGYSIRHLLSANGLTSLATVKDEVDGKLKSVKSEVNGPTSMMFTTTHTEINFETYNRFIIITIDESHSQTKAILIMQRKNQTLEGIIDKRKNEKIRTLHHNAQRLLKSIEVVNPYAERLIFTDAMLRARREQQKYMNLIKTVALLRQYQKEVKTSFDGEKSFSYIEVDKKDIEIANKIASKVFAQSMDEVTPQTKKFLNLIDKMVAGLEAKLGKERLDIPVSRREMREYTGWSDYQVRKHIIELSELEYLIPVTGQRGKRFTYCLAWDKKEDREENLALQSVDNL